MTAEQCIRLIVYSRNEHIQEAQGITEALCLSEGRLIVRDMQGKAVAITNRCDYARAVRMNCSGTIYDRADWRNNPAPLY